MPYSEKQQHAARMALAYNAGKLKNASSSVKRMAKSMTAKQLKDFATSSIKKKK